MEIKLLTSDDRDLLSSVGAGVFDDALHLRATAEFLADPRHHLVVALEEGRVVGFVSAVHYVHPDKPAPEMWINELGVAEAYRGQGVGKAMLKALLELAGRLGCTEAWVLTDRFNPAAMQLYASCGGIQSARGQVMFTFPTRPPARSKPED